MIKHLSFNRVLAIIIVLLAVAHIAILPFSPPGFFLDESAGAAHVVSMIQQGANAHGETWPLFSASLGGGYTTPIYLYPLVGWAAIFGTSELALRAFSLFATLMTATLIMCTASLWQGRRTGLIAGVVTLSLPWAWIQGSIAWDPALVPLFVALPLLALSILLRSPPKSRVLKAALLVALPLSLIALAYLYPPARITAPLLFIAAYGILLFRKAISYRTVIATCILSLLASLPLAAFMLQPESLERSRALSIFHDQTIIDGLILFVINCLQLLNPIFLFITGDPNLRHATGIQGMLGIATIPAIAMIAYATYTFFKKKQSVHVRIKKPTLQLLLICLFGITASIVGSALTNEGQPHSLRATAAWPFMVIIIAVGWQRLFALNGKIVIKSLAIAIFALATIAYIIDLAVYYPTRSADSFDAGIREQLIDGQDVSDYPELSKRYYQNR